MKITLKLFATFRDNRFKVAEREYADNATIGTILEELGISEPELGVALINGRHVVPTDALVDGGTVSLFPKVGGG